MQSNLVIYTSKWIIPITSNVIRDGALVKFNGKIVDFGEKKDILSRYHGKIISCEDAIICPGLINAHTHMELSYLKGRISDFNSFSQWLRKIIASKGDVDMDIISFYLMEMKKKGVCAIIDIGNNPFWFDRNKRDFLVKKNSRINYFIHLNEIIDPKGSLSHKISLIPHLNTDLYEYSDDFILGITPHSPYTVHPDTIKSIKKITNNHSITSVHLGESVEENELFLLGKGGIVDILKERGYWPLSYIPRYKSPTIHLNNLNFLDKWTICVHCVFLSDDDIDILGKNEVSVVICPRSNILLSGKMADIHKLIDRGINVCIGTDSLASNDRLSVFAEMSSLKLNFPGLCNQNILEMATINGARAMKLSHRIGSIEKGKDCCLFAFYPQKKIEKTEDVLEYLIVEGEYQLEASSNDCLKWLDEIL